MGQTVREKFLFNGESAMKKKLLLLSVILSSCTVSTVISYSGRARGIVLVGIGMMNMGIGKITEYFSYSIKNIVRSQGGTEGHRVIKRTGDEYELSLIPSGIMRKDTVCYLTAGMDIDPQLFLDEIRYLQDRNISTNRIWVSAKAQVIFPYHKVLDECMSKLTQSSMDIGSLKGTGSAAACKRLRIGIRMADLLDEKRFEVALKENLIFINNMLVYLFEKEPYEFEPLFKSYRNYAKKLQPYIQYDLEINLNKKLLSGQAVLFEGAQGSSADITFGAYPYVSSSSTLVSGICTGAGIGPNKISRVIGIVPSYVTVAGETPLATEFKNISHLSNEVTQKIATLSPDKKKEYTKIYQSINPTCTHDTITSIINSLKNFFKNLGLSKDNHLYDEIYLKQLVEDTINTQKIEAVHAATKQSYSEKTRYGWIDLVMIREAILLNGIDSLVLTKLDALDDFDEIKICIDYKVGNKTYDYMPSMIQDNKNIEPVYITLKGWKQPTSHIRKFSQLPEQARDFIKRIELLSNTTISHISVGPERDQIIVCEHLIL